MKQIYCEMCGSNEVYQDGDLITCTICGSTFTKKEQEKIVERIIEKQIITQDESENIDKLLMLARNAKEDGNDEDALNYYKKVYELNPENWEGYYYTTIYTVKKGGNEEFAIKNCIEKIFPIIYKNEDYKSILPGMLIDIKKYSPMDSYKNLEYIYDIGKIFEDSFKDDFEFCKKELVNLYELAIKLSIKYEKIRKSDLMYNKELYGVILNMIQVIDKYCPGYEKHFMLEIKKKKIQKEIEKTNERIKRETSRLKEEENNAVNYNYLDKLNENENKRVKNAGILFIILLIIDVILSYFIVSAVPDIDVDGSRFEMFITCFMCFGGLSISIIGMYAYFSKKSGVKTADQEYDNEVKNLDNKINFDDSDVIKRNRKKLEELEKKLIEINTKIEGLNIENKIKNISEYFILIYKCLDEIEMEI